MSQVVTQALDRTLAFKRARLHGRMGALPSLREMLDDALNILGDPDRRAWTRDEVNDGQVMTVLNFEQRDPGSVFAEMMKTFPGQRTFAAEKDVARNRYRLLECAPPSDTSQFLRGVLFFYVYGNGVVIMSTNTYKASELDDYLTWFLREAQLLSEQEKITLDDEPMHMVEENIDKLTGARSIRLSASMADVLAFRPPENDGNKSLFKSGLQGLVRTFEGLVREATPGLPAIGSPDGSRSDFEVTVEVSLPKGQRSTAEVLDAMAVASRGFRGVSWSARLDSGFRLGGGVSAVSRTKKILHENRYPSYADARRRMAETLQDLIDSGLIGHLGVYEEP